MELEEERNVMKIKSIFVLYKVSAVENEDALIVLEISLVIDGLLIYIMKIDYY